MSETASSTGTPTTVATYTDISGPQASCMLPVLPFLMGPHMNFIGGLFLTKIGLSVSKLSFFNMTTGRWSATCFTNAECAIKDTSIYSFSTPLSLHDSVAFFIAKVYCTLTSFLIAGAILRIGTATIGLATCVPHGYISLCFDFFPCNYNLISP